MRRVEVIIIAYNEQAGIAACLRSVLKSDYQALRVTVLDDCSTDETYSIACSFKDARLACRRNAKRLGPARARNLALKNADADFVFFLDADCTVCSDWVEQGVACLSVEGVVAVEGAIHYANPEPSLRHYVPINPFYNLSQGGLLTIPGRDYGSGNFAVCLHSVNEVGGFNTELFEEGREDTDLGIRLARRGRIAHNLSMRAYHRERYWTLRSLLLNARRYRADVVFFKQHGFFFFRWGRILHPKFLWMLLFPPLILFHFRFRSLADVKFLPKLYLYLLYLRLVTWRAAISERILII